MSLIDTDLALLRTAVIFDLSTHDGRKESVKRLRNLFYHLHEILKPQTVFEIGAKEATFSRTILRLLPDAKAIAFEANPYVFAKQMKENDPTIDGVDYRHLAVSDRTGDISFFVQVRRNNREVKKTMGSNSLLARLGDVQTKEVTVPSTRIDDLLAAEKPPGPMSAWIDVEGAISLVLGGLSPVLSQFEMVFAEVEEREFWAGQWTWPKVHAFFAEQGFIAVARDFEFDGQNNVLFLRPDVLDRSDVRKALTNFYSGLLHPVDEVVVKPAALRALEAAQAAQAAASS